MLLIMEVAYIEEVLFYIYIIYKCEFWIRFSKRYIIICVYNTRELDENIHFRFINVYYIDR